MALAIALPAREGCGTTDADSEGQYGTRILAQEAAICCLILDAIFFAPALTFEVEVFPGKLPLYDLEKSRFLAGGLCSSGQIISSLIEAVSEARTVEVPGNVQYTRRTYCYTTFRLSI